MNNYLSFAHSRVLLKKSSFSFSLSKKNLGDKLWLAGEGRGKVDHRNH